MSLSLSHRYNPIEAWAHTQTRTLHTRKGYGGPTSLRRPHVFWGLDNQRSDSSTVGIRTLKVDDLYSSNQGSLAASFRLLFEENRISMSKERKNNLNYSLNSRIEGCPYLRSRVVRSRSINYPRIIDSPLCENRHLRSNRLLNKSKTWGCWHNHYTQLKIWTHHQNANEETQHEDVAYATRPPSGEPSFIARLRKSLPWIYKVLFSLCIFLKPFLIPRWAGSAKKQRTSWASTFREKKDKKVLQKQR